MTSRRTFLRSTTVAAAGLTVTAGAAEATPAGHRRPTFVFVPGSHGNAQYLAPLTAELTLRGFGAVTVELPGHGAEGDFPDWYCMPQDLDAMGSAPSSIASLSVAAATERVVGAVRRAAVHGPVVLVGHSLGGTFVGTAGNAVPHLIDRAVYVSAFCLVDLPSVAAYTTAPENAGSALSDPTLVAAPLSVGALRVNWRSDDPVFVEKLRQAYLVEATPAQFRAVIGTLQPDESLLLSLQDARVDGHTWGRIPRTYVRFSGDRATMPALQDRMIREADALTPHNRFDVRTLPTSHLGMAVDPRPLADVLAALA
ncbi:alpha/beta hydrolase [Kibdelosporangium lantanae]